MSEQALSFVVPTHRLREVGETVETYDDHFCRNGHSVPLIVFDDSSVANFEKYYPLLEQTRTRNPLYYVGPREKERFISYLDERLRDRKLTNIVKNLFRPSYGGNRNFTLMYTLGGLVVSADDDMRPYTLIEDSPETLGEGEVCRGKWLKASQNGYSRKSFDILTAFLDVLGKPVNELPANHERGEHLIDTAMDLETNTSNGFARENSLLLASGALADDAVVKMAQTYRSGTGDIDASDYIEMFLDDGEQNSLDSLSDVYVLVNFRPVVTKRNWRMDCGVAGYDNSLGLPPFFPTRLRFEDYIYRLWIQQEGIAAAHVDAAQSHIKSNYMRNPLAFEVFNEEIANLLKQKIKGSLAKIDELSISFDYDGEVTADDAEQMLSRVRHLHARVFDGIYAAERIERAEVLRPFAANLEKAFYGFELDFFQQNLQRIVDDVITQFKGALDLWPTLVEICYLEKKRRGLPMTIVKNRRR